MRLKKFWILYLNEFSVGIVGGNPARVIGEVAGLEERMLKYNMNTKGLSYEEKRNYLLKQEDDRFIRK
ncbi:hypothetical protein GCM10023091_35230 [Ravibacter arvi]|uniref:Uncharacterized protein n=1 Tax=Ravibacter arvi TaxID=2051041 RepID=A0ABP8M537_9BACT